MKYLICSKYKQKNLIEKFVFLFSLCILISFSSSIYGQNKPLDNWDLEVLNKKSLQNETYFSFTKRGEFNRLTANTLLRYGVSKNIELQVNWTGEKSETIFGNVAKGASRIGVKAFLMDDTKYLPGISLIGSFHLTADPSFDPLLPSLNVLFRKGIVKNFTLTGNWNFILDEQSGELSNEYAANLDIEWTNWLTSYIGVKGEIINSSKGDVTRYQEYIELGMLFWVADGIRFYPSYDFGLGGDSDDIINVGILYHFK